MEHLTSFIFAVLATIVTWYWVAVKSDQQERMNDLCDAILDVANLSTEYWLLSSTSSDLKEKEARILGRQHQVVLLLEMLGSFDWSLSDKISPALTEFLDHLTGGNFESLARPADLGRAKMVQISAAALAMQIRQEHIKSKRWWF